MLVVGGSKIGGSKGRLKEGGDAGCARENEGVTFNVGEGINVDDGKDRGVEVRYSLSMG